MPQLEIANAYLQGELQASNAASLLVKGDPFGMLLAGEVLLDQATKDSRHMVSTYVRRADGHFNRVIQETNEGFWKDGYDHASSRARAQVRLAQLSVFQLIYAKGILPGRDVTKGMYRNLARLGSQLVESRLQNVTDKYDSAMELRGVVSELSVLLLGQRYALREVGSQEWLPLQSSFSEDNGGSCVERTENFAWDINIFTAGRSGSWPEQTYAFQVKNLKNNIVNEELGPTLYVIPDLSLQAGERSTAHYIIRDCNNEMRFPQAGSVTEALNARTEKLLDFLG